MSEVLKESFEDVTRLSCLAFIDDGHLKEESGAGWICGFGKQLSGRNAISSVSFGYVPFDFHT